MAARLLSRCQPKPARSSDPVGDALFNAPAFQDIVRVEMTKTAGGDLELLMEMAGSVPVNPPLPPPGNSEIWWMWVFDLDPTTFPVGYPLPPKSTMRRMNSLFTLAGMAPNSREPQ